MKTELVIHINPDGNEWQATIDWPFPSLPRIGEEILGMGIADVLVNVRVTSISWFVDEVSCMIFADHEAIYSTPEDAAECLKEHGWHVQPCGEHV